MRLRFLDLAIALGTVRRGEDRRERVIADRLIASTARIDRLVEPPLRASNLGQSEVGLRIARLRPDDGFEEAGGFIELLNMEQEASPPGR